MIARAENPLFPAVPDGEREIAEEMLGAIIGPGKVCVEDQIGVACVAVHSFAGAFELISKLVAAIQTRVGDNPAVTVEADGLPLVRARSRSAQKRVSQADRPRKPCFERVGSSEGKERGQGAEQATVDRRTVALE